MPAKEKDVDITANNPKILRDMANTYRKLAGAAFAIGQDERAASLRSLAETLQAIATLAEQAEDSAPRSPILRGDRPTA